ncbi:DNA helicase B [Leptodactylus fuscus]|uniref:DNA helicase B n=1 Tax=Leptodactylus fuscus TaxID=238119 RepID=UPI003F4EEC9A
MSGTRGKRGKYRGADYIELRGRLLPIKDEVIDEEGSDSDSEGDTDYPEDSEPEFLDADEIDGGATQVRSWKVPSTTVKVKTEDSHEYIVNGSFPLTDPWWIVTIKVKAPGSLRSQNYAIAPPAYELDDDFLGEKSILPLFLTACKVPDEFKKDFTDWLQDTPVSFSTIKELAVTFCKEKEKNILPFLENVGSGAFAIPALDIPLVMKYLPRLLPSKIRYLFMLDVNVQETTGQSPRAILQEIEAILAYAPWKLGFSLILYRELQLCGCEASWGNFCQCEDLLEMMSTLQINALKMYTTIKNKCMDLGDTYVDLHDLTAAVTQSKEMSYEAAWEALEFLKGHEIVVVEMKRIFLYNYYWYEVNIAKYIHNIALRKSWNLDIDENDIFESRSTQKKQLNPDMLRSESAAHGSDHGDGSEEKMELLQITECTTAEEPKCSTQLDADQKRAVKMILANPVTVISGKGGCGKTTVVSLVFKSMMDKENDEVEQACKALEEDFSASDEWFCDVMTSSSEQKDSKRVLPIRVLLTAPTGKAASLLRKKTGLPAATLHQVTCSYSAWRNLASDQKKWKFSKVEALVVDEASLVSVRMFSAVLKLLYCYGKLAKLVILGDVRQLPSIEPGNMLTDVFAALKSLNWAIELKTNHRAESQLIVDNATRISNQHCVEFDANVHVDGKKISEMPSEDSKVILVSLADNVDLSFAIQKLLKNGPGLQDDKHSQFITFRRTDCLLINDFCCRHYSGHTIKNQKSKFQFQCNDKVCCTKNAYVKDLLSRPRNKSDEACSSERVTISQPQVEEGGLPAGTAVPEVGGQARKEIKDERLCNGEIFFIIDDVERSGIRELTLSDGEDRTYTLNYKALRSRSGLQHAWARTIHTFQGSEEDTVVYVLGTAGRQNWKHVYTAVTRGRKRVYIIAKLDQLDRAIANKARDRKTRLQQRLKELLLRDRILLQPTAMPSTRPDSSQAADKQATDVTLTSHPVLYTQLKPLAGPSCPPGISMPKTDSSRSERADHIMCIPPDCLQDCVLEESPSQKRIGDPVDGFETPKKSKVSNNDKDWTEESPNSQRFQLLSLESPSQKKLFN